MSRPITPHNREGIERLFFTQWGFLGRAESPADWKMAGEGRLRRWAWGLYCGRGREGCGVPVVGRGPCGFTSVAKWQTFLSACPEGKQKVKREVRLKAVRSQTLKMKSYSSFYFLGLLTPGGLLFIISLVLICTFSMYRYKDSYRRFI